MMQKDREDSMKTYAMTLPRRVGPRPLTHNGMPHAQIGVSPYPK